MRSVYNKFNKTKYEECLVQKKIQLIFGHQVKCLHSMRNQ